MGKVFNSINMVQEGCQLALTDHHYGSHAVLTEQSWSSLGKGKLIKNGAKVLASLVAVLAPIMLNLASTEEVARTMT
jgi:hypothetical protein